MFRNSKSDRDSEGRTPVEDGVSLSSALDSRAGAVASSALRWLSRSRKSDGTIDGIEDDEDDDLELTNLIGRDDSKACDPEDIHEEWDTDLVGAPDRHDQSAGVDPLVDEDEEVELSTADRIGAEADLSEQPPADEVDALPNETEPVGAVERVAGEEDRVAQPPPAPDTEAVSRAWVGRASVGQTSSGTADGTEFFDYDDDDDLEDFDDLSDIANIMPSSAFDPEALPEEPVIVSPSPADHVEPTADAHLPPSETIAPPHLSRHEEEQIEPAHDLAEFDRPADDIAPLIEPVAPEPVQQDRVEVDPTPTPPVDDVGRSPSDSPEPAKRPELEEAPAPAPLDTSLALQPIPELQTGSRSPRQPNPPSSAPAAADAAMSDEDGDGIDVSSADLEHLGSPAIEASDLDDLDIDQLDTISADLNEERVDDDWHAHLAEVLCDDGKQPKEVPSEATKAKRTDDDDRPAVLALSKPAVPKPIVTKPVAKLTPKNTAEDEDDDVPVPPILTRKTRQQTRSGDAGSTEHSETDDLSQEQLSIGIITNVQRLRRFAAVQIGDEQVADQLVKTTVESAFAECPPLPPKGDLGLALMMLLYKQRREMAIDPDAPQASTETIRAFEATLCVGLSGADQFEIRAFAQAMNELDEQDRELLVLIALENLSYEQIGEIIRIPTQQVMNRLANARLSLRQALSTHNPGLSEKTSRVDTPHGREIEIHGYLDGELDGHHMADVDALVEYDEDAADRLLHYGIQGDLIRRLYAPLINRPIPHPMLAALATAAKRSRRGFRFGSRRALIAGGVLALVVGSAAAWTYVAPAVNGVVPKAMALPTVAIDLDY